MAKKEKEKSPRLFSFCVARPGSTSLLLQAVANRVDDRLFIRKLASVQLGVNQLPVHGQLEATSARGNQVEPLDLLLVRRQQLVRQTDGLRLVVSHRAVTQFHVHRLFLSEYQIEAGCF
jgi:hypothetical protein